MGPLALKRGLPWARIHFRPGAAEALSLAGGRMARINRTERLLNLLSFLLKSRRPVTLEEIRETVAGYGASEGTDEAVERRFERDKAALREIGVPLEFVSEAYPGGPGYVIPRETCFLPRMEMSSEEAALLAAAGRFALTGAAGPVSDALRSALRKVQFDAPLPGGIRETAEERFLFHRQESRADLVEEENLRRLARAVLRRQAVRFQYYAISRDKTSPREVEPYGLGFAAGHWYLAGRDRGRGAIRVFRVDRIRGEVRRLHPQATRPEFEVPRGFRIQDYLEVPPWMFGKAEPQRVRLRFDAETAFMVRMRSARGDSWQEEPDGSAVLTRRAANLDALLNWILGFGRRVEVLEPSGFRRRVIQALEEMARLHQGPEQRGPRRG